LVRKPDGKKPVRIPRRRWVDNIKKDLVETESNDVDGIGLVQDKENWRAFVNAVINLRVPSRCWETVEWFYYCWDLE
jgi:hypothetical protein